VGNDDYTDISSGLTHSLQGADTAAPIWAEFMNRAIKLPQYSDMKSFSAPDGVQLARIDKSTWLPADETCPEDYSLAFLDGTVPANTCSHMSESPQALIQGLFPNGTPNPNATPAPQSPATPETTEPNPPKKKTILQKIFGGGDKPAQPTAPPQ
jgi:penicillin-binding protein 1B